MKMKNYVPYISIVLVALFFSCKKEETPKPKVIYEDTSKSKGATPIDTTQIEVADLPINMEGTNFLIHPIGVISGNGKGIKSSSNSEQSFTVSNYGEYEITGYLKNLKFQEMGKDSIYVLTDKQVLIETATYLKTFADKSKQQLLVYTLADMDTNKDGTVSEMERLAGALKELAQSAQSDSSGSAANSEIANLAQKLYDQISASLLKSSDDPSLSALA